MLEDRIIVQDRGIDAGLAALMQNANKGSMDPAALLAMMNNNGMGGNGGWWWIWIILLFFCWGGNGFGFGGRNAGALASELNTDANTNLLMQAINGNKDAISTLSTTLNCDINSVQTALNTINTGVSQIACDTKLASCEVINAITSGNASLASQLASCCCDVRSSIADVNNNITKMGYESQLSMCNQTNTLQSAITSGFNSLLSDNTTKFNVLGSKIDAQTQIINDKFCQLEMREMQNKIDALRQENNQCQYDTYKQRKEAIAKCDEEMAKCQQLLDKLEIHNEPTNENSKIVELQNEINELKNIIRKANQMVPPPMKDMLPQDMKDAMNKVDQ